MPKSVWPAIWLLTVVAAPLGAAGPALQRVVTLSVEAEQVQYDHPAQQVTATGGVQIRGELLGEREPQRVLIRAGEAEADLGGQEVDARGEVRFVFPGGLLQGESLSLQPAAGTFTMPEAQALINLAAPGKPPILWQMRGREIVSEGGKVIVRHGQITPYLDEHAPLSLRGDSLTYDPNGRRLQLRGGQVDLYGIRIPLIFQVSTRLGAKRETTSGWLPVPRWTSRDGLTLPYYWELSGENATVRSNLGVNLSTRRGITFRSENSWVQGPWDLEGFATKTEFVAGKLTNKLVYDRLPELIFTRYQTSPDQDRGWQAGLSLGNFRERLEQTAPPPTVTGMRAQLSAGYGWGDQAHQSWQGTWGGALVTGALYEGGDHYTDAELYAGSGTRLTPWLRGGLTLRHHFLGGATPFAFDRVDIRTELQPNLDLQATRDWRVQAGGRWDVRAREMRNYSMEVTKRMRYLTWGVQYNSLGNAWGLRFYINGLSGDLPPPPLDGPRAEEYLAAQKDLWAE